MSDVLIRGMAMPYGCANCPFVSGPVYESYGIANYFCKVDVEGARGNNVTTEVIALYEGAAEAFPRFCPLVEVQTPHARLIDADALLSDDEIVQILTSNPQRTGKLIKEFAEMFVDKVNRQPTIIEAEWSKE